MPWLLLLLVLGYLAIQSMSDLNYSTRRKCNPSVSPDCERLKTFTDDANTFQFFRSKKSEGPLPLVIVFGSCGLDAEAVSVKTGLFFAADEIGFHALAVGAPMTGSGGGCWQKSAANLSILTNMDSLTDRGRIQKDRIFVIGLEDGSLPAFESGLCHSNGVVGLAFLNGIGPSTVSREQAVGIFPRFSKQGPQIPCLGQPHASGAITSPGKGSYTIATGGSIAASIAVISSAPEKFSAFLKDSLIENVHQRIRFSGNRKLVAELKGAKFYAWEQAGRAYLAEISLRDTSWKWSGGKESNAGYTDPKGPNLWPILWNFWHKNEIKVF